MSWLLLASVVLGSALQAFDDDTEEAKGPVATAEVQTILEEAERLRGEENADSALGAADRALALARAKGDDVGAAFAHRQRALALESLDRTDDALAAWQDASSAWELQRAAPEHIEALCARVRLFARVSDVESMHRDLERVVTIASEDHSRPSAVARSLNEASEGLWRLGQFAPAGRLAEAALVIAEGLAPRCSSSAVSLNNLGIVAEGKGDLVAADDYLRRALEIYEDLEPGSLVVAGILNNMGMVARKRGDLESARGYFGRALQIQEERAPGSFELAAVLGNLGIVSGIQGDLESAREYFTRALDIQEDQAPDSLAVAGGLNNLGVVAWMQGDFAAARDYFGRALSFQERQAPGTLDVAASLNNLGNVADDQGDLDSAREYHRRALEIREKHAPGSLSVATSLNNLGIVSWKLGDLDNAREYNLLALKLKQKHAPASLAVALSLGNLGLIAVDQGDLEVAREHFDRALEIQEKLAPASLDVAGILAGLGTVASKQGSVGAARDYHLRALRVREKIAPGSLDVAMSLGHLGNLARVESDLQSARDYYQRAWQVVRQQAQAVTGDEAQLAFMEQTGSYAAELIRTEIELGRPSQGLAVLEESRAQGLLELFRRRGLQQSAAPELWRAFKVAERRRDQLGEKFAQESSRLSLLERDLSDLEEQGMTGSEIAPARNKVSEGTATRDEVRAEYTQARVDMQARLAEVLHSVPGLEPESASPVEVREALAGGSVFVAFSVGTNATTVIVVPPDPKAAVRGYVVDLSSHQLAKRVDFVRDRLGVGRVERGLALADKNRLENASRLLYRKLFPEAVGPILETAERVVISPDGPLWDLPFAALDTGADDAESPRWLGLEKSLSYAPSLTTLVHAKRRAVSSEKGSILVVGDPMPRADDEKKSNEGDGTSADRVNPKNAARHEESGAGAHTSGERTRLFPNGVPPEPLPGARDEAKRLGKLYESEPLIGLAATESVVRARLPQATIVHLATHGYFHSTQPMSSGVLLAPSKGEVATGTDVDGALQAWEILSALKLRADLVVLSACETGLGRAVRGEGLVGLTRALQAAGANSVVATHWKVADDSTTELMVSFHQKLRAGARKDDALRDAMREVAGRPETSHPYFWAAFFLSGASK